MQVGHELPQSASIIMVLGSNDPRVAERAVDLFKEGRAPRIIFSGGVGTLTEGLYGGMSEAAYFERFAIDRGVPPEAIMVEGKSTNTGENIRFSRALLESRGIAVESLILVQKPFMERRTLATFLAQWAPPPQPSFFVTSPRLSFREYPIEGAHRLGMRDVIEVMCGDLQRIAVYPKRGFQAFQEIPANVWAALHLLVREGFGRHMILSSGGLVGCDAVAVIPESYEGLCDVLPPSDS